MLEILHAGFRHLLEINDDAGLVLLGGEIGELLGQALASCRFRQHFRHIFYGPVLSVVVIDHGHDRDFKTGRFHGLHPGVQLRVLVNLQMAIGPGGVQRIRNQQVDIVVMQLKGGQAGRIVFFVEGGAQRIVVLRDLAQRRDLALAATGRFRLQKRETRANRVQACVVVRLQNIRKFRVAADVDQKNNEHDGEKAARNFQHTASAPPAAPLLIVENRLAFRHRDNPS